MSQQTQNQSVTSQPTTPQPNQPQPTHNEPARRGEPDAFARLAEAVDRSLKRLNHPKVQKSSFRRESVRLVPAPAEKTSASSGPPCASGPQPRQNSASREDFLFRASPAQGSGCRGTGSQPVQKNPARSPVSPTRTTGHEPRAARISSVHQAKNYLRATRSPKFLRPNRSLERHARKCVICHHLEREMIEELFVRWHSPEAIANFLHDYDQINWVSIYRHAYALGLDAVRRRNLGYVFEHILDYAADATPTAAGVVAAARAISCIGEDGRWVEPEKRILMTTLVRREDPATTTSTDPDAPASTSEGSTEFSSSLPKAAFHQFARSASLVGAGLALPAPAQQASRQGTISFTALPKAAVDPSAAAPQTPPSGQPSTARRNDSVAASASTLPGAALNQPAAAKRTPPPVSPSATRSATREIRLPLNSQKTKDKPISNR